jgi:hypothetical protein
VVVGSGDDTVGNDRVGAGVARRLREVGHTVLELPTGELASVPLELRKDTAWIGDRRLEAALFFSSPGTCFSAGFVPTDQGFVDNETRATWLTVLSLPSVWTLNRPDPEVWFTNAEWTVWRQRLRHSGVGVAPLDAGCVEAGRPWLPYCGESIASMPATQVGTFMAAAFLRETETHTTIWCCGEPLTTTHTAAADDPSPAVTELELRGCRFFSTTTDSEGRIVRLTTFPTLRGHGPVARAAELITEACHAHCDRG